jgi:hypothetical protein
LLLSDTSIGEKKNFVWKEPGVDLPQQIHECPETRITDDSRDRVLPKIAQIPSARGVLLHRR